MNWHSKLLLHLYISSSSMYILILKSEAPSNSSLAQNCLGILALVKPKMHFSTPANLAYIITHTYIH